MWSLFHTSGKHLARDIVQKLEGQCFRVEASTQELPVRTILDTALWYLLTQRLVLEEETAPAAAGAAAPQAAGSAGGGLPGPDDPAPGSGAPSAPGAWRRLLDGSARPRWQGPAGDAGLDEHIAGLLQDWPLKEMGRLGTTRTIIRAWAPAGSDAGTATLQTPAAGSPWQFPDAAAHVPAAPHTPAGPDLTITLDDCRLENRHNGSCKGALLELAAGEPVQESARKLVKHLCNQGAIQTTWPLGLLAERFATCEGWNAPETAELRRAEWSDQLAPLIRQLELVRDSGDAGAVHELRVMLRHVRILLDISRRLAGKTPPAGSSGVLEELEHEMDTLRHLDVLIRFLETGRTVDAPTWLGIPGILASCPELSDARRGALLAEVKAWRTEEHLRVRHARSFLAQPILLHELSARWPPIPRFTKRDKGQRQRMSDYLEVCVRKLIREIKEVPEVPALETWQGLRWRCRKITEVLDTYPSLKKQDEVRFLRQMVRLWLHRLGELQDILSSMRLLEAAGDRFPPEEAASAAWLAASMAAWVDAVSAQVSATLPALHLAARNTRKELVSA